MRTAFSFFTIISILQFALAPWATAAPNQRRPKSEDEMNITYRKTSAPPSLSRRRPKTQFRCRRYFYHREEKYNCDSLVQWDGEGLRQIIKDVPEAVHELDIYQSNRRSVRWTAYTATAGILIAAVGFIANSGRRDAADNLIPAARASILAFGAIGIGITAGSIIYGKTLLSTNESHLERAVENYNRANPKDKIRLQLNANIAID